MNKEKRIECIAMLSELLSNTTVAPDNRDTIIWGCCKSSVDFVLAMAIKELSMDVLKDGIK